MDAPRHITYLEDDSFFLALDQFVREGVPIVVTVPSRPPEGSKLYQRLYFCPAPVDPRDPSAQSKLGSARMFARVSRFVFTRLFKKPNYRGYSAEVFSKLDPMEVHLNPI